MELDVYDALIRGADAANQKIPELVNYLRICGYPATGSNEGDAVTDPEVEIGNYTIQILIRGGYCLTHRGTNGKIRFWPVHRAMGAAVNDMIEDIKKTAVPETIEREQKKYRLYHATVNECEAEEILEALHAQPENPHAVLIEHTVRGEAWGDAVYYCIYLQSAGVRGRRR